MLAGRPPPLTAPPLPAAMHFIERLERFPTSTEDEVSVFSWNLLAPSNHGDEVAFSTTAGRELAICSWLERAAACDIICVQELDRAVGFDGRLQSFLAERGFESIVQDRRDFPVVNATFFKAKRFHVTWTEHRSRVLLCALRTLDGREFCIANVHLQAHAGAQQEAQRKAQLTSALRRLLARAPWAKVVCGDFNSSLESESELRSMMLQAGLTSPPATGPTLVMPGFASVLDHVWASAALRPVACLRSCAAEKSAISRAGLPSPEYPSDHLPVAMVYRLAPYSPPVVAVEEPHSIDEAIRAEWLAILSCAPLPCSAPCKKAAKEQRQMESSFLGTLQQGHAQLLRAWHSSAAEAAKSLLQAAVLRAVVSVCEPPKVIDPGGRCRVAVAGG